jgi:Flp pilus assembly protein TadG
VVTNTTTRPTKHSGQIMIIFALAVVVLTGFVALGIDVGYALSQRRELQNSADAAALAVAQAMLVGTTDHDVLNDTATNYIAANGFDNANVSLTIDTDATPETVTVDITSNVQKFFIGLVYQGPWKVGAHAVASLDPTPSDYALLALDQTGYPVSVTGNVDINIVGGSAMSNAGMKCVGNGRVKADHNLDAHTGFSKTGNCGFAGGTGMNSSASIVSDPLASVPPPPKPSTPSIGSAVTCSSSGGNYECPKGKITSAVSVGGNNHSILFDTGDHQIINTSISGGGNGATITLNPGTYYFKNSNLTLSGNSPSLVFNPGKYLFYMENGSMTFNGNSHGFSTSNIDVEFYFKNSTVSFTGNTSGSIPPGIYYFDGQGPSLTGNQKVTGDDVLFFFDNGASFDTTGNTAYSFTAAPTSLYSGGQTGMVIYSARGNTGTFKMTGNSGTFLGGIVYLPDGTLSMTGNTSGTWAEGQLIVDKLTNVGNTDVSIKYKNYVDITTPAVYLIQ